MRLLLTAGLMGALGPVAVLASGQTAGPVQAAAAVAATATPMARPSTVLGPSLTALQTAMSGVRLEKWKMSGELRDAADGDLRSIERDFKETLPPLLETADAEPGSVAKVLPVLRNVSAVYDVALRVTAMGRLTAPAQQSAALEEALAGLADARKQMGDQLQATAEAEAGRVLELQASLKAREAAAAAAVAAPVPQPAVKPAPKPKKKKIRPKPAAGTAAAGAPAGAGAAKQP